MPCFGELNFQFYKPKSVFTLRYAVAKITVNNNNNLSFTDFNFLICL